ncbi:MAG: hypothetical protein ACM3NS_07070 [Deltaproteobacteria bacterium]
MFRPRAAVVACVLLATACRIEDHTPTGSRSDDEAIQHVLVEYTRARSARDWPCLRELFWGEATYELALPTRNLVLPIDSARQRLLPVADSGAGSFDVRILRSDTRQEGDLAAAWLLSRRRLASPAGVVRESDYTEHLVLRRVGGEWRILSIALAGGPRRRS